MAKKKRVAQTDLVAEDMLLAQEDIAETRPSLAMAPELVAQNLALVRKRRARTAAAKASRARKKRAPKARKTSARKGKAGPKKVAKKAAKRRHQAAARKK